MVFLKVRHKLPSLKFKIKIKVKFHWKNLLLKFVVIDYNLTRRVSTWLYTMVLKPGLSKKCSPNQGLLSMGAVIIS